MRLLVLPLLLTAPLHAADAPRRNVVLMVADDLGLEVGCYGDKVTRTPNLDALARSAVRFSHAFASCASCSASRSTLYTGLPTHANGQYGHAHAEHHFHTRAQVKSLPALLRAAGYRTGLIGKNHVVPKEVYPWDVEVGGNARNGVMMASQAAKFLDGCGEKKFCLVLGYTDPHRAGRGFGNNAKYPGLERHPFAPKDVPVPSFLPDIPEVRADLADYYESVHRLDQNVGLVLDLLKKTGRDKDTLVIFLSDNGIPFPGAKTTLYDAGIRLPLIVRSPAAKKAGVVNPAMVCWTDVMPTILDWAGVKPPSGLPGRSFLPTLEEESPRGWDEVYASHTFHEVTMYYPMRAVRTRRHKYIRNVAHKLDFPFASDLYASPSWQGVRKRGDGKMGARTVEQYVHRPLEELYDVEADPAECRNLAADPRHAKTMDELRAKLRAWQEKTRDPWVVKYEYE